MSNRSDIINLNGVIEQVKKLYRSQADSEYIFSKIFIDGKETRGQLKDNERITNVKEENTKYCTCFDDCFVKRGSYIEIHPSSTDLSGKILTGVVYSIPNKTVVDYYFTILLFNTTVQRRRMDFVYNDEGDIVNEVEDIIDNIPAFVQRVGMRERSVDAGIDRNSINRLITIKTWDIQKDDILYIGADRYIVTDLEELDEDILTCYMTYYRE